MTTQRMRDRGASAVEYGLMVAAIAAVIVGVVFGFGFAARNLFAETSTCLDAGPAAINPCLENNAP